MVDKPRLDCVRIRTDYCAEANHPTKCRNGCPQPFQCATVRAAGVAGIRQHGRSREPSGTSTPLTQGSRSACGT
jgi:hypothetical protein